MGAGKTIPSRPRSATASAWRRSASATALGSATDRRAAALFGGVTSCRPAMYWTCSTTVIVRRRRSTCLLRNAMSSPPEVPCTPRPERARHNEGRSSPRASRPPRATRTASVPSRPAEASPAQRVPAEQLVVDGRRQHPVECPVRLMNGRGGQLLAVAARLLHEIGQPRPEL